MAVLEADRLTVTLNALANPTRRSILERLAEGEATVNELAEPFDMSLPAISRHIKVLEHAGLVAQGQRAQYRPCRIEAEPLRELADWAERYRPIWESRLDQMADYLNSMQANTDTSKKADQP